MSSEEGRVYANACLRAAAAPRPGCVGPAGGEPASEEHT